MNNRSFLLAVFLLSACGGESGGSNTPHTPVRIGTVTPAAEQSNALITNMVSEIGIVQGGTASVTPGHLNRSGTFDYNGEHYISYKLDNVDLKISDWGDDGSVFVFSIDKDGRIDGIKQTKNDQEQTMKRISDTEFEFLRGTKKVRLKMESFAKDVGLQYADISTLSGRGPWSTPENENDIPPNLNMPVIMGYQVKKISNTDDLGTDEMVFKGVAVGTVANHYFDAEIDDESPHDYYQLAIKDDNAQLKFNNGTETLNASFNNWYDIEVVKNGDDVDFTYENPDVNRDIPANAQFKFDSAHQPLDTQTQWTSNYYGNEEENKEATTMFRYVQPYDEDAHVEVVLGFGGKEQ